MNRARGKNNINKYWDRLIDVLGHVAPEHSDLVLSHFADPLDTASAWPAERRHRLARALLRFDRRLAAELVDWRDPSDADECLPDRVAVLAVTAPGRAADLAQQIFRENGDHDWMPGELAKALLGERDAPGASALRPLARTYVRAALTRTRWSSVLPQLAELEPEAVMTVYERLRESSALDADEARHRR